MSDNETDISRASFLGTGWSFPPEFSQGTGDVQMTSDEEDIEESLRILFNTSEQERFMNPGYGLDMHEMLFESMNTTTKTYLSDRVKLAILIYEPRIELLSVDLDASAQRDGRIGIVVDYKVRATNSRYNMVYPFYQVKAFPDQQLITKTGSDKEECTERPSAGSES